MRKGFWWTNVCNFLNKFLGLYRTKLKIVLLGDSYLSDLFILADKTVALFRRIFIDGNFQSFFIHYYMKEKNEDREKKFTTYSLVFVMKNLLYVTVIFILTSPIFVKLFKQNSENQKILLFMIIGLSPLIIGMFLISFFTSLLNANNKFEISSTAPLIGNLFYVLLLYLSSLSFFSISPVIIFGIGALSYAFIQVIFMSFFSFKYFSFYKKEDYQNLSFKRDVYKGVTINLIVPLSEVFVGVLATIRKFGVFSYIEYGHRIIYSVFSVVAIPISTSITPLLSKLSTREEERVFFEEESIKSFMITHILTMPCIFIMFFFLEEVILFFLKNMKNINNKEMLAKSILIISFGLYFMMQIRILNCINNAKGKINDTLKGAVIYGWTSIIAAIIFPYFGDYGFIWVGNAAYFIQFLFLMYSSLRDKILKFRVEHYFDFGSSIVISFSFILMFKKFFNYFVFMQLPIIYSLLFIALISSSYFVIFWHYLRFLFKK